uniref:Uncharacterized protein n=1 Tax=Salix viminalis TaxID=40686 RepID=A0A6N2LSM9_SALVM
MVWTHLIINSLSSQPSNTHLINKAIQIYKCSFEHIQLSTNGKQKKHNSFCQCVFYVAVSLQVLISQNFFWSFTSFFRSQTREENSLSEIVDNIAKQQRGEKQRSENKSSNLCGIAAILHSLLDGDYAADARTIKLQKPVGKKGGQFHPRGRKRK